MSVVSYRPKGSRVYYNHYRCDEDDDDATSTKGRVSDVSNITLWYDSAVPAAVNNQWEDAKTVLRIPPHQRTESHVQRKGSMGIQRFLDWSLK